MSFKEKKSAAKAKASEVKGKSKAKATSDPNIYVGKLGESQVMTPAESNDTVFSVLSRVRFPEGAIMNKTGKSVTNLIEAAQADVQRGVRKSIEEAIKDIRVNATPAKLDSKVVGGDIITMVPDIEGG